MWPIIFMVDSTQNRRLRRALFDKGEDLFCIYIYIFYIFWINKVFVYPTAVMRMM
jgi:hypothetical protein